MTFKRINTKRQSIGFTLILVLVQLIANARHAVSYPLGKLIVAANPSPADSSQSAERICPADIGAAIEAIKNRPQFQRFRWGILIETLSPSQTLYAHDDQNYFIPASNVKVFTTAAALHQLSSQFRIRTSVYDAGGGSLRVVGRGDPSFTETQLRELAQQLKRRGITQVNQLRVENDYFQGSIIPSDWEWGDLQENYGAPVSSLILNQNTLVLSLSPQTPGQPLRVSWVDPTAIMQWQIENTAVTAEAKSSALINVSRNSGKPVLRVRGQLAVDAKPESVVVAVLDPADYFLRHFRRALIVAGIPVAQALVVPSNGAGNATELAAVESPPLSQLVMETNQNSNNLYAEALLRTLGISEVGKQQQPNTTAEAGLAVVKATLSKLGVDSAGYVLADGSGLSRHNLVSPAALVQTLKAMAQTKEAAEFRASLPVGGISGTLKSRFRGTAGEGRIQAKTGTMSGVVSLSGYVDAPNYQPLVFSILVNQSDQPAGTIRQAMDEIVLLLTQLHSC